jgi:hypothetical protein
MAIGIPVLAADVGVLPGIVTHGDTGYIFTDSTEFARYARELAADPDLRRRMGTAGQKRVAEHYSIHGWADTIAEVLIKSAEPGSKRHLMSDAISPSSAESLVEDRFRRRHRFRARQYEYAAMVPSLKTAGA